MSEHTTDLCTIKTWPWRGPAGETANLFVEVDADVVRGDDAEIARVVERFEKSLRAVLTPPSRVAMKNRTTTAGRKRS